MRSSHVPLRLATGAYILNSGLSKRDLPAEAASGLQDMGSNAVPQVTSMSPSTFGKVLSNTEIALGAALLAPFVSPVVAGAALTTFSGLMMKMYLSTPALHEAGSVRPTTDGTAIAKDVWLTGVGLALLIDGLTDGARRTAKRTKKGARRKVTAAKRAMPVG